MEVKSVKNVEVNKYEVEVAISPEEFEEAIGAVFKRESKKLNVPGFRKGHAPRAFIEKYYGETVFYEAAVDHLYRPMVMEAVEKSELTVISVNDVKIDEIGKDKGVKSTITVITKPEAQIEGYKGIPVVKEPVTVSAEDVDREIERVRERNSRMVTVEDRPAENGDIVEIDFEGFVDDVPFEGGKGENQELTLGAGQFIPGFEEQVIGHNSGEEFDIDVTFPEDYHAEELKGKAAVFKIKLHEIKKKELPDVDDEFVKDVSEFDTMAEYRADIEKSLLSRREQEADSNVEGQVAEAVIEKTVVEIPQEMVEQETEEMINSFAYRLRSQGLSLEVYLQYTGMTTDDLQAQYRPQAERQLRLRLGLEKIAALEGIEPSEEEIEEEFKRLADQYEIPLENIKGMVRAEDVKGDVTNRKVMELLKESAVVSEKKEEPAEEKQDEETPAEEAPKKKKRAAKKKAEEAAPVEEAAPSQEEPAE